MGKIFDILLGAAAGAAAVGAAAFIVTRLAAEEPEAPQSIGDNGCAGAADADGDNSTPQSI